MKRICTNNLQGATVLELVQCFSAGDIIRLFSCSLCSWAEVATLKAAQLFSHLAREHALPPDLSPALYICLLPAAVDQSMPLSLLLSINPCPSFFPSLCPCLPLLLSSSSANRFLQSRSTQRCSTATVLFFAHAITHTITHTITHNHNTHLSGDPLTLRVRLFGL
jgi:hypothetical protein